MKRLLIPAFLLLATPAMAHAAPQKPPPTPAQVDQAVRSHMADLANASAAAQAVLAQMPELYRENVALKQQLAAAQAELAKLKAPAKPEAKPHNP